MTASSQPSSRIRVLQIIGNAIVGGMETSVARLLESASPSRFALTALCPFESPYTDQLRELDVDVCIAPMPDNASWEAIQVACSLIETQSIDVVHTHLPPAHLLGGLAGRLTQRPVVATIHGRQLTTLDLEVHRRMRTHLHLVCRQSHLNAHALGIEPDHISFIPNGVDTEVFKPSAYKHGPLRQRFGIPAAAKVVGFVGRLSPEKGPDLFVRMALALHEHDARVHFLMVGDGPMRAQVEAAIAGSKLDNVFHLAGVQESMADVYREMDMFVSSSRSEAMPLAIMEAMGSGLPTVATSVGGILELVQQGRTGWLVGEGDYESLAARALALLSDETALQAVGAHARERAVRKFALMDSVAAITSLWQRLAQQRGDALRLVPAPTEARSIDDEAPRTDPVPTVRTMSPLAANV